jgi:L-aminopeptidase/D-esterase-like protein
LHDNRRSSRGIKPLVRTDLPGLLRVGDEAPCSATTVALRHATAKRSDRPRGRFGRALERRPLHCLLEGHRMKPAGGGGDERDLPVDMLSDSCIDRSFDAVVEATGEAILNELVADEAMVDCDSITAYSLPHDGWLT